jgi:hypothetical protein
MANHQNPLLRSAMKHSSRPSTPTPSSGLTSPNISPPSTTAPTLSRTHSNSSVPDSHNSLRHPLLPHHAATSPSYTHKVSFDTFENPAASMFSFTLQVKTEGYRRSRNTRVFLCASSPDESGSEALEWCLESLVQDGDELIVFRGADEDVLGAFIDNPIAQNHLLTSYPQKRITTSCVKKPVNSCAPFKERVSSMILSANCL